jgi:TPR repeat protein
VLLGEGTLRNISKAEELYDAAAEKGSTRALNGHGFMYFYGLEGIDKNEV